MINPDDVEPDFAHLGEIAPDLVRRPEVMAFLVRTKRAVGDALDEELAVAFKEEFRDRADRSR